MNIGERMNPIIEKELRNFLDQKEKELTWHQREYKGDTWALSMTVTEGDLELGPSFGFSEEDIAMLESKDHITIEDLKNAIYHE